MYSEEYLGGCVVPASTAPLSAQSLGSVADVASFYIGEAIELNRIMFLVSTAVVSTAPSPVVSFYARPTFGSSSGQVLLGALTIPPATAAGVIVYKPIESVKLEPGYTLAVSVTVATSGGGAAGAGFAMFKGFLISEDPKNVAQMLLSV